MALQLQSHRKPSKSLNVGVGAGVSRAKVVYDHSHPCIRNGVRLISLVCTFIMVKNPIDLPGNAVNFALTQCTSLNRFEVESRFEYHSWNSSKLYEATDSKTQRKKRCQERPKKRVR